MLPGTKVQILTHNALVHLQKPQEAHRRLIETLRALAQMRELSPVLRHIYILV